MLNKLLQDSNGGQIIQDKSSFEQKRRIIDDSFNSQINAQAARNLKKAILLDLSQPVELLNANHVIDKSNAFTDRILNGSELMSA